MDILIGANVSPDANSGAAGTVMETTNALVSMGNRVDSFWSDAIGRRISHGNLHYILELPRGYRRVVRDRIAGRRYDVVQLSQPYAYLAGKMLMRRSDRPLMVWRSHGLEAKVDEALALHVPQSAGLTRSLLRAAVGNRLRRAQQQAVRWSDGAIVPCADDRRFLIERFGADPDRVRVIWHGVPDVFLDKPTSTQPDRWRRVLHVSQMSANKGPLIMNQVASRLLQSNPSVEMTWICPGHLHDGIRSGLPEDVLPRVRLRGWIDRSDLLSLYDSHGIFLFPTLAEGAAKVVMEAMARGMCVVSSDTSGPSDYICSGRNGLLVPVGDMSAMSNAVSSLLADGGGDFCSRLGEAASHTARAFRWERCAREMVQFYGDLGAMRA